MDQAKFDRILNDVLLETSNRKKGAFKRALWYGGSGFITKKTVGSKGLRKQIRNAPRKIVGGGIGKALGTIPVPLLADALKASVDPVMGLGKNIYSSKVKSLIRKDPPMSTEEALRKRAKADIKSLKDKALLQVVDRNMVKLRDAKNKIDPSIQELMKSMSHMSYVSVSSNAAAPTDEKQTQKAHDALRAVAETEYYVDKIVRISASMRRALEKIEKDLDGIKSAAVKTRNELEDYIKEYL